MTRVGGQTAVVFVVRGTKKLLDRVGKVDAADERPSTTVLGDWYATVWFWRPQVALFVNERTLIPVLLPMAPASTVVERLALALPETSRDPGLDPRFVEEEVAAMAEHHVATTASRSVLGVMNEFKHMADGYLRRGDDVELTELALWLAQTPCGPLYKSHVSPDRELRAVVADHMP